MRAVPLVLLAACAASSSPSTTPASPPPAEAFTPTSFSVEVKGAGRPVVFIPGLGSPGSVWDATVAHLGGRYQTHVLTLAGMGGAKPVDNFSLTTVHDEIVRYIQTHHLDHPIVVGHSLGGAMTLWLAETSSADLGGIVDVDGLPFIPATMDPTMTEAKAAESGTQIAAQLAGQSQAQFEQGVRQFTSAMVTRPADQEMVTTVSVKTDRATFIAAFSQLWAKDLRPQLSSITVPVTIVAAGSSDIPKPQLDAAWHAQIDPIKGAAFHMVDDAKHFVFLDQPAAFYALLDAALAAPHAQY